MNDLQVALVGVWGVILVSTQTRSLRSPRRRSPRPRLRDTFEAVVGVGLGLIFAGLAAAHFTGIHRQKNVHVLGSFVILLIVLAIVGMRQRRADLRKRAAPHESREQR